MPKKKVIKKRKKTDKRKKINKTKRIITMTIIVIILLILANLLYFYVLPILSKPSISPKVIQENIPDPILKERYTPPQPPSMQRSNTPPLP
ncbi:hypothetical protein GOV12_03755 [Candidatus Pacearchaeota archaeon]|nr:hypothetical protein [Candidatus Pacearchaeota archaeon]